MKKLLLLLILLETGCKTTPVEPPYLVRIVYINPLAETFIRTSCNRFDYSFANTKKEIIIRDKDSLIEFEKALSTMSRTQSKQDINVRIKVFAEYRPGVETVICMDQFKSMFVNGGLIKRNKALINFIWPLIEAGLKQ